MREYDGIERRYRKSDLDLEKNLNIVQNLLGFRPSVDRLDFDLSFYSGGIGIYDKLAISCDASSDQMRLVRDKLRLYSPNEAIAMKEWEEDFIWLVTGEESCVNILSGSAGFINQEKAEFQDICLPEHTMLFSCESNVNDWTAIWGSGTRLNYAYFNQG